MRPITVNQSAADLLLVNQVLNGEDSSFEELVIRHKDYAYSIAMKILGNPMDAEEVAHDAFVKAYKSLKNFNQKAKFTTWLYRIVFNSAISRKRKSDTRINDLEEAQAIASHDTLPDEQFENIQREEYVKEAIAMLQPVDATIITLFYLKQMNLEEIGEIVSLNSNAVKVKLHRARKRLAVELGRVLNKEAVFL